MHVPGEKRIEDGISKAITYLNIRRENREVVLKKEQETAVKELLAGKDVVAVLPTGFGKSLIFTVFTLAREEIISAKTCVTIETLTETGNRARQTSGTQGNRSDSNKKKYRNSKTATLQRNARRCSQD